MKLAFFVLGAALGLAGCQPAAPVTDAPAGSAAGAPASRRADSAMEATTAPPADGVAAPPATPRLAEAETLKASFRFAPSPSPDDPRHPRTSAHLLVQGHKPLDIDLGTFAGRPDVVDAAKARAAGFPDGMLLGFRSYSAAAGSSQDLAVLSVDGHRLRVVQRRVAEGAEPGPFITSREVPLPDNTVVVAAPMATK